MARNKKKGDKTNVLTSDEFQRKLEKLKEDQPCLVLISGAPLGRKFPLIPPRVIIGRGEAVELRVDESSVSREHAEVEVDASNEAVVLTDLRSTNGTYVNDVPIDSVELKEGDIIRLGTTIFKYLPKGNIENVFVEKMHDMANIDAHTKIFNKKYSLEYLDNEFIRCRSLKKPLSIILFDLDHFKKINDTHGHVAGDFILEESCRVLKEKVIRGVDIFGRFGGEEFLVILPDTKLQAACSLAERIRNVIEDHDFVYEDKSISLTLSLGVTELNTSVETAQSLLKRADHALYNAKNSGRNRVCAN